MDGQGNGDECATNKDDTMSVVVQILQKQPEDRLTMQEIKAHRWFAPLAIRQRFARRGQ